MLPLRAAFAAISRRLQVISQTCHRLREDQRCGEAGAPRPLAFVSWAVGRGTKVLPLAHESQASQLTPARPTPVSASTRARLTCLTPLRGRQHDDQRQSGAGTSRARLFRTILGTLIDGRRSGICSSA